MTRAATGRGARLLGMMIGGEAVQSGLHFALNVALIKLMPAHEYGVFAIVMVIGGLGLTYIRALTAMPATITIARSRSFRVAAFYEDVFGLGATIIAAIAAAVAASLLAMWAPQASAAGGCFVGLWCLRSHARIVLFARGRQGIATFGDLAFASLGAALTAGALWQGGERLGGVFFALALANGVSWLTMQWRAGAPLRLRLDRRARLALARMFRRLAWSGLSVTAANLQGQGLSLLVGGFAGPAAYAPIAAMIVAFAPLRVASTAVVNLVQPEVSRLVARGAIGEVRRYCKRWTALLAVASLVYGAVAIAVVPLVESRSLAGAPVVDLALLSGAITAATLLYLAPRAVLEVLMKFREVAVITAVAGILGMGAIALILRFAAPSWALGGALLAEIVVLVAAWIAALAALRRLEDGAPKRTRARRAITAIASAAAVAPSMD